LAFALITGEQLTGGKGLSPSPVHVLIPVLANPLVFHNPFAKSKSFMTAKVQSGWEIYFKTTTKTPTLLS